MEETEKIDFLSSCTSGGCGAKIGSEELKKFLSEMPVFEDENLLVGFNTSDDAAVYKLSDTHAIISTTDFFSPMVNSPYSFGKIAAANAMSDVYAMGGDVLLALNIVCFPQKMDKSILSEILKGGAEKIAEAGAFLSGGHSIYDHEPKYGLAVTGTVHPKNILKNNTANVGDYLILTKPLGVGLILSAMRVDMIADDLVQNAILNMERLNKYSAEKMKKYSVSACTDVTGFGLLGHAFEMTRDDISIVIDAEQLPILEGALQSASDFCMTSAAQRNRNFLQDKIIFEDIEDEIQEVMFDPQTSGGLLISINPNDASKLLEEIKKDDTDANIIGEVVNRKENSIIVN